MIYLAGEADDMWWDGEVQEVYLGADLVWKSGPTIEVYEISRSGMDGNRTFHSLITLSPPPGEVWHIEVEGNLTFPGTFAWHQPTLRVGNYQTGSLPKGRVNESGEITSSDSRIGFTTDGTGTQYTTAFSGTVTVTYP